MSAISQTINNVLGGVSQQPDPVKLPGQVRQAVNVYLDPTFGCTKRPGTRFIANLGSGIPTDAKWFPIFRSETEQYIGCIYQDNIRVWNAVDGTEATVTYLDTDSRYLENSDHIKFRTLTVNDYTFVINGSRTVTIDVSDLDNVNSRALVVVNQVAYNTTYGIDFLKDGDSTQQVEVRRVTELSVTPEDWEIEESGNDGGSCAYAATESFVEDQGANKTGLGFTLTTTCNPTLVNDEVQGDLYPTKISKPQGAQQGNLGYHAFMVNNLGFAEDYAVGSYVYVEKTLQYNGGATVDVRIESRVEEWPDLQGRQKGWNIYANTRVDIIAYDSPDGYVWKKGTRSTVQEVVQSNFRLHPGEPTQPAGTTAGFYTVIDNVRRGDSTIEYRYKSVYRTQVTLNNPGTNFSIGDVVTVTMDGKQYKVKVENTRIEYTYQGEASVSYTSAVDTAAGPLNVGTITSSLVTSINALADYSAESIGNVIVITRDDGRDFNLHTRGGTANGAMYGVKDTVNDISRLPPQCIDGFTLKVSNSEDSDADDYYVKFETSGSIPGQGSWIEASEPGTTVSFNPYTMPHVLERDDAGDFTFRPLSRQYDEENFWAPRDAGDNTTNPAPTFVDKQITDAVFYQNRLGFISGESIVLSQAGDYFNFFQGSAIAISDGDPIDLSVSSTKPAALYATIGTPSGLLLFAQNSQFLLKSEDVAFGPATVRIDEITSFAYRSDVQPLETGVSVLFPTSADTYSKVYELAVDSLNSRPLVSENTRIIPEYIPPNLTWGTSAANSSLVLLGDGSPDAYVFKFYNTGNERNLAGWTKWTFPSDLKYVTFYHDTGYFVLSDGTDHILTKLELIDDPDTSPISAYGQQFSPRIDNYIFESALTVTENTVNNTLRVDLPSGFYQGTEPVFVVATSAGTETFYAQYEVENDDTGDFITVPSSFQGTDFIIGLPYTMTVELPSFFVKEGDQNVADRRFPPMVEMAYLDLYYSGRYSVEVVKKGYNTRTIDLGVIDADIYLANSAAIENFATREIPVFSRGDFASLTITASDPLPASLTSYSWEGHYNTRGIARR